MSSPLFTRYLLPTPAAAPTFRADINGLRAWAVLAVVLYHFNVPGVSGGFIGVDLFFVISGYLMTGAIIGGLQTGRFSLRQFYAARARRIIPALWALCVVLLLAGLIWLPSVDLQQLSQHSAGALGFMSNFMFWREAGYFAAASHDKWLLHTWSLSVEWQFYLLLPLACLLAWRLVGQRGVTGLLLSAGLFSLALSLALSTLKPTPAFYLLPTRAWELLAGSATWWLSHVYWRGRRFTPRVARAMEWLGFALIIGATVSFTPQLAWPGYAAAVPVLAAMLILLAAQPASPLTAHPLAQYLGLRSYSLYLWHWPLAVLLNYSGLAQHPDWVAAALLASLMCSELSLRAVENPARQQLARWRLRQQAGACLLAYALLGALIFASQQPWPGRIAPALEQAAAASVDVHPRRQACHNIDKVTLASKACVHGQGPIRSLVLGDSFANAVVSAVTAASPGATLELSFAGCPTVLGIKDAQVPDTYCVDFNQHALATVNQHYPTTPLFIVNGAGQTLVDPAIMPEVTSPPTVYFDQKQRAQNQAFNARYTAAYVRTLCAIKNPQRVYVLRPLPVMPVHVPNALKAALLFQRPLPVIHRTQAEHRALHAVVWQAQDQAAAHCGIQLLNPLPYLCQHGLCPGHQQGQSFYYDQGHLNEWGNKRLVPLFERVLRAP
ncbi:MAG: acyltransferase family protein [Aeromonas sp.]